MRALAWTLFGAVAVLAPTCVALGIAGDRHGLVLPEGRGSMLPQALIIGFASLEFAVVGLLIARRQQRNPIGWIFLASGALLALVGCAYAYADLSLYGDLRWPLTSVATWLTAWAFVPPVFVAPCLIALLFPTGKPLTPRWRYAVWFVAAGLVIAPFGGAFASGLVGYPDVENPAAFPVLEDIASAVDSVGKVTLAPTMLLLALTSIVLRFRRSRGVERLQLKWVASAGSVMVAGFFLAFVSGQNGDQRHRLRDRSRRLRSAADRRRCRDPPLPALRHRSRHLEDARLRGALTRARCRVRGARARRAGAVLVVRGRLESRDRDLDAGGGGAVPAGSGACPGVRRPAVLPAPLRRPAHAEAVRRAAARAGRPRHARARPVGGRRRDDAAHAGALCGSDGADCDRARRIEARVVGGGLAHRPPGDRRHTRCAGWCVRRGGDALRACARAVRRLRDRRRGRRRPPTGQPDRLDLLRVRRPLRALGARDRVRGLRDRRERGSGGTGSLRGSAAGPSSRCSPC